MEHCSNCNREFTPDPDAEFWFCPTCDTKNMSKGSTINRSRGYPPPPPPHTTPSEHRTQQF